MTYFMRQCENSTVGIQALIYPYLWPALSSFDVKAKSIDVYRKNFFSNICESLCNPFDVERRHETVALSEPSGYPLFWRVEINA